MLAAPPWMRTKSGYFLPSSKLGGRAIILWILLPRLLVNQKWRSGSQSIAADSAALKLVSARWLADSRSIRTTSAGWTALSQLAICTGAPERVAQESFV